MDGSKRNPLSLKRMFPQKGTHTPNVYDRFWTNTKTTKNRDLTKFLVGLCIH